MRILFITKYAWDDKLAGGNTLSNLFSSWPNSELFTIYCRESMPQNQCCINYFSISPINIVKNILSPQKIGKQFILSGNNENNDEASIEESLKKTSKKYKYVFETVYDMLYASRIWLNKKLKKFINEANPDIVFCFGVPDAFTYQMVKYVKGHLNCAIVSYYVDDHYNNVSRWNLLHKLGRKRLKKIASMSDKRYAISQMMCDEYEKEMHTDFNLLFKGCVISEVIPKDNSVLQMTYAGNLFYQRDSILAEIATIISNLNVQMDRKAHLDIYTSTTLCDEIDRKLNIDGVSKVHQARSYKEIVEIMQNSDIALFVESFDPCQVKAVRLSFSTKITDCLQAGTKVLAIGPSDIASIAFLKSIPGVTVISNLDNLKPVIQSFLLQSSSLADDVIKTNEYSKKNFTVSVVRKRLQNDFIQLSAAYKRHTL